MVMQKVTAAVIEKDGRILIARRKAGDAMGGKWEFPGGKLEPGETPEECLKRELKEELGIEAEIQEFLLSSKFTYRHMAVELLAFRTSHVSGEITLHEHERIAWILPEELDLYDFPEADKPILERLKDQG